VRFAHADQYQIRCATTDSARESTDIVGQQLHIPANKPPVIRDRIISAAICRDHHQHRNDRSTHA
jgi:hypothetical protein